MKNYYKKIFNNPYKKYFLSKKNIFERIIKISRRKKVKPDPLELSIFLSSLFEEKFLEYNFLIEGMKTLRDAEIVFDQNLLSKKLWISMIKPLEWMRKR